MANFGLWLIFICAIGVALGGFIYNRYKDKSGAEKHNEIITSQKEIKEKGDLNAKSIIDEVKAKDRHIVANSLENSPTIGRVENQTINYFQNDQAIKNKKMDNKKRDSPNVVNVTSYNQSGGITANQVNIGSQPRVLNVEAQNQLLQILSGKKSQTISVVSVMGDGEAFSYATQIKNYLIKEGYTVSGVDQAVYTQPIMGQQYNPDKLEFIIGTKQ